MAGLTQGLPVTVSLGESADNPFVWIDCVVRELDGRLVVLTPRAPLSPRLQERVAGGESAYLVYDHGRGSVALRGFFRLAGATRPEFLVLEHSAGSGNRNAQDLTIESEPLLRLMYVSQAAPDLHDVDFDAILRDADARNTAARITGALCLQGGFFGQILEGPERAVRETFERIKQDSRHSEPLILVEEPARRRLYGGWAMKGIHGENAITAADELAARLALAQREDSVELTRRWMELLRAGDGPSWSAAWLDAQQSVLMLRELIEQTAPPSQGAPR